MLTTLASSRLTINCSQYVARLYGGADRSAPFWISLNSEPSRLLRLHTDRHCPGSGSQLDHIFRTYPVLQPSNSQYVKPWSQLIAKSHAAGFLSNCHHCLVRLQIDYRVMDVDSSMGEPGEGGTARKRVSTACEACRATKIKCQPSEQPGVCRK